MGVSFVAAMYWCPDVAVEVLTFAAVMVVVVVVVVVAITLFLYSISES